MEKQDNLPRHIAIIMDGNGRWAKKRFMPRIAGHRVGAKVVRSIIKYCNSHNIEVLSLFALSVENFINRPQTEVSFLLSLFSSLLDEKINELHAHNICVRFMGDQSVFDQKLQNQIRNAQALTCNNTGLKLVIAANYSGRWDIFQAAKKMAASVIENNIKLDSLSESDFSEYLCLADLPEPDLMIRTSGEQRISNFMLWQLAYSELCFVDVLWPDFDDSTLTKAVDAFKNRQRRFGRISEQLSQK